MNVPTPVPRAGAAATPVRKRRGFLFYVSPRRISAIYALLIVVIVFSIWTPQTFLTDTTFRTVLGEQAITAVLAVGLTVPLATAAYDLSSGYVLGLSTVAVAYFLGPAGWPVALAIVVAIVVGGAVGLVSGLVITRLRVDSFITTLGMGSVAWALTQWLSDNQLIIGLPDSFGTLANGQLLGIQYPVYYLIVIALAVWFVMEYTPLGRYFYATGGNYEAARLSGLPTRRVIVTSLLVSSVLAGFAGVLLASRTSAGSPNLGANYLLPAFAAIFLGSTQFRDGTPNIWGTVISVYLLAFGVKGLQLVGAPFWIPDLFNGAVLIIAVGFSKERRSRLLQARRRNRDSGAPPPAGESRATTDLAVASTDR